MTPAEADALWRAHHASLTRVAARMVGPDDAADVVQDTFLRALWADPPRDPGPWLRTVCRNRCRDVLRSRRVWQSDGLELSPDPHPTPEQEAVAADLARHAAAVAGGAVWAVVAGERQAAVAKRFGVPLRTLKGRLRAFRCQMTVALRGV